MNHVSIIGRLGQDPEIRYTPSGKPVTRISIAVNERLNGGEERTHWIPVICWNGLAEVVAQYLQKGSRIAITGRITSRTFETDDGTTKKVIEVVANSVDFLDPKAPSEAQEAPDFDDDIPF